MSKPDGCRVLGHTSPAPGGVGLVSNTDSNLQLPLLKPGAFEALH